MAQKIIKWFVTDAGKKFTFGLACCTSVAICGLCTVPHTVFINKYKEVVQLYESGIPVKLSKPVLDRYEKTVEMLNLSSFDKNNLKPFTMFGFDIFSAGTLQSKYGGIVGIPSNYTYIDKDRVDKAEIMVNNEPVDWCSDEGQQLFNSLLLSEKAQMFAIAREIKYLSTFKILLDAVYSSGVFITMYGVGHQLNNKYNLYAKPLSLRLCMYTVIAFFGYGLYAFLTDYTQTSYDFKVDRDLCETNRVFVEGGKEFYDKMISRNIALRKLMGRMGEGTYSVLGNENYLFRQRRLPLINRRDFFSVKTQEIM